MSFVDVPTITRRDSDPDPALADKLEVGRLTDTSTLRVLRRDRELTTAELGRLAGIPNEEIIALENGAPFNVTQLHALAAALDVPASLLSP